jgi:hypothetical protein
MYGSCDQSWWLALVTLQISPLDVDGWHLAAVYNGVESQHLKSDDEDLYFKIPVSKIPALRHTENGNH